MLHLHRQHLLTITLHHSLLFFFFFCISVCSTVKHPATTVHLHLYASELFFTNTPQWTIFFSFFFFISVNCLEIKINMQYTPPFSVPTCIESHAHILAELISLNICSLTLLWSDRIFWRRQQRGRPNRNMLWRWSSAKCWSNWRTSSNRSMMMRTSQRTSSFFWRGWEKVCRISGTWQTPFYE